MPEVWLRNWQGEETHPNTQELAQEQISAQGHFQNSAQVNEGQVLLATFLVSSIPEQPTLSTV